MIAEELFYAMNEKSHVAPHGREADTSLHDRRMDGVLIFLVFFLGLCAWLPGY